MEEEYIFENLLTFTFGEIKESFVTNESLETFW
jgi:hypothetical protein